MGSILESAVNRGIKEAEVFYLDNFHEEVVFENNTLKTVKKSQSSGAALRMVKDGRMGFVSSTNLADADKLLDNAEAITKYSEPKEFGFAKKVNYSDVIVKNDKIWDIPDEKMIEDGYRAVEAIKKYDTEILTNIKFLREKQRVKLENTNGVDASYDKDILSITLTGNLTEGTNLLQCYSMENGLREDYDICQLAEKTIEKIRLSRNNCNFEQGKKAVIFTPKFLGEALITLQAGLSGMPVSRGISPLCNKLGEKIFDERVTVIDDGTMEGGCGSIPFDDEGVPAQRTVLIENGVLKSYIHSLKSAEKLGQAPTGNSFKRSPIAYSKEIELIPQPYLTNMIMKPGNTKFEDMVADIKDGIIIDYLMGIFTNNLMNGDFGGNIGMGYVIKDGKIVGRVKDATINANIYDIFNENLVDLSDSLYSASPFGDFISLANHRLPYAMFKDINVTVKK